MKTGIDVVFNDIERKVIDPTETPDYETQEQEIFAAEVLSEEQRGGGESEHEEEDRLEVDGAFAL